MKWYPSDLSHSSAQPHLENRRQNVFKPAIQDWTSLQYPGFFSEVVRQKFFQQWQRAISLDQQLAEAHRSILRLTAHRQKICIWIYVVFGPRRPGTIELLFDLYSKCSGTDYQAFHAGRSKYVFADNYSRYILHLAQIFPPGLLHLMICNVNPKLHTKELIIIEILQLFTHENCMTSMATVHAEPLLLILQDFSVASLNEVTVRSE